MTTPIIHELTSGSVGWLGLRYLFFVSLSDKGLRIRGIGTLPLDQIERVVSEKYWGIGYLRIIHHSPKMNPKVRFISTKWKEWFDAFSMRRIVWEDPLDLYNSDAAWLKAAKAINLVVGAGAIGLVLFGLFRLWKG